jgi:hypothetical protein
VAELVRARDTNLGNGSQPSVQAEVFDRPGKWLSTSCDNDMPIEKIADLVGHNTTNVTQKVYRNSRVLHQPGEKPQVTRSQQCWNTVPGLCAAPV